MTGSKIYFGDVVGVADDEKLNRIQVSIPGKTDKLSTDELSWYYPFLGMDQVPIIGDKIPVFIFNDDFTSGLYLKKIVNAENAQSGFDGSEYENYLEIYKRLGVQLTYNETDGIQFIRENSKIQLLEEQLNLFVRPSTGDEFEEQVKKVNHFKMTHDRFDLGTNGEATPLGDKTVAVLLEQLALSNQMYDNCMKLFKAIFDGCNNPYTMKIKLNMLTKGKIPQAPTEPKPNSDTLDANINKIQSKKTWIE